MPRWKSVLGLLIGAFLLLSACAHSFLGGKAMTDAMAKAQLSPDLAITLLMGWMFGGVAMFICGGIVTATFVRGIRKQELWLTPARVISAGYVVFAIYGFLIADLDPFGPMVFGAPGVLLAVASSGSAKG